MILVILLWAILSVGAWLIESLWLMLAVGDMHLDWWPAVPLMSFNASMGISLCLDFFLSIVIGTAVMASTNKS